jgi:hypothetical protein
MSLTEHWPCDGGYACLATEHIEGCFTGEGDPDAAKGLYVAALRRQLQEAKEDPITIETARMFYERALKAEAEVERLNAYINNMPYPSDLEQAEADRDRYRDELRSRPNPITEGT